MNIKKTIQSLLIGAILSFGIATAALAETKTVVATGEGVDYNAALRAAQRNAIEQAIGVYVDSTTLVVNFQTVEDKIKTHSAAFIKSFKEIGNKDINGIRVVQIEATITDETAAAIKDDLTALGIALDQADRPKIMVYYDTVADAELAKLPWNQGQGNSRYITEWAVDVINGTLGKKGFDYVLREQLEDLKNDDEVIRKQKQVKGDEVIRLIANKTNAEYYMKFKVHLERGKGTPKVAISISAFESTSGIGKGAETGYGPTNVNLTLALKDSIEDALLKKSGVVEQMLNYIKKEASQGKEFVVLLDNINDDDQLDDFTDFLETISKKVKTTKSTGDSAEFSVWADQNPTDFMRTLRKKAKGKFNFDGKSVVRGNRVMLFLK